MSPKELAELHQRTSRVVAQKPFREVLLWYADLGLVVQGEQVEYHCPGCGTRLSMFVEEFIEQDDNAHLKCDTCRGPVEERGGPLA